MFGTNKQTGSTSISMGRRECSKIKNTIPTNRPSQMVKVWFGENV